MWLGRTVGITVIGLASVMEWSCSSSSPTDINLGQEAGSAFEAPPREVGSDVTAGGTGGAGGDTGAGGAGGQSGSTGSTDAAGAGTDAAAETIDTATLASLDNDQDLVQKGESQHQKPNSPRQAGHE
jgi:hypothetical protein